MSIEDANIIDLVGIDRGDGNVILTISDHLPWDEDVENHLWLLQEKINTYLAYIETGQILKDIPDAMSKNIIIDIVAKYNRNDNDMVNKFFDCASEAIESAGFKLRFSVLSDDD